ncbi:MAG TPA: GAF domain-containing protein [Chthoniobacterales bacterium]|nr:GAF domain-containing protein [Chthoniobacterales bacterium]
MTRGNSEWKELAVQPGEQELSRLNRILQTLYQCNHALVHATDEQELFQSICGILVEVGGLRLAWVGRCEEDSEKTVRPVAMAGYGIDYLENAKISWSETSELGRGPTGIALRTGKPYWVKDCRTDPCFAPWRAEAEARGYASSVSLPLIADGMRIGSLGLYAGETNAFNENTIQQYLDLANNLAHGVGALRAREEQRRTEEALRDSEQRLQDVIDNTTAVIFLKDLELRYLLVNREFERRHLISRDEIRGKTDYDFYPQSVAEAVRANDRRVIEAAAPIQFEESVPSAQGNRYYICSKFLLRDRTGKPYAVCGIATDATQLKRTEEAHRRRARQAALREEVQRAFADGIEGGLRAVLERIAKSTVRHLNAAAAHIWVYDEQGSLLELQASAGQPGHLQGEGAQKPSASLNVALIARVAKPYLTNDLQNDECFSHPELAKREGLQAFAGYPLMVEGRSVGVLGIFGRQPLSVDIIDTLGSAADAIAQGIARKKAAEKISEHAAKLSRANEVLRSSLDALARHKELQSFVDHVLAVLTEQLGGHSSTLWLVDVQKRTAHLHSVCQGGRVVVAEESDHLNASEPRCWSRGDPFWLALQLKRPFLQNDVVNDPRLGFTPNQRARFAALGVRALLLVPLVFGEELNGLLSVRMTEDRQLDEEDLEFARSLAQQATLAIELAKLAEQAKQTALAVEKERAARERAAELTKANEALRGCLDALASVPELDEFLGQVMAAMTRQLGAASSILRLRNFEQNALTLDLVFQEGRVMTPAEAKYPPNLRILPLDERQMNLLKGPATVLHLLDPETKIPHEFRSYLLSLGAKTSLVIPLNLGGQLVGSVTFGFTEDREFRVEELEIARALASQASLAIQLTRLAKGARQAAVLEERNELVGEIHDSLAQLFTGISMQLGAAKKVMQRGGDNSLHYVERAIELAQFGLAEARRTSFSMQPSVVEELGLIRALEKLAERSTIPGRLECTFDSAGVSEESLAPSIQQDLLRIAQEAISNAARHAKPTQISIRLNGDPLNLALEITDNGSGITDPNAARKDGFGLSNMQARAASLGAKFEVRTAPGEGTTILVCLPMRSYEV